MSLSHCGTIEKCNGSPKLALPQAIAYLRNQLLSFPSPSADDLGWKRLEVILDSEDIKNFLLPQTLFPVIYWQDRDGHEEAGCLGIADKIQFDTHNFPEINKILNKALNGAPDNIRYFCGVSFDEHQQGLEWNAFPAALFVLPRIEIIRSGDLHILTINFRSGDDVQTALLALDALKEPAMGMSFPSTAIRQQDLPNCEAWVQNVEDAIQAIQDNILVKLVLARRTDLTLPKGAEPLAILQRLQQITPHCFHFLFRMSSETCFLGASPERLYRRDAQKIFSEALAGTRPRGQTPEEDERLKNELIQSPKEILEHKLVVRAIQESLSALSQSLRADVDPSIAEFKDGQHLSSLIEGELKPGVTDADILDQLHPTPAVAGSPTARALEHIRKTEPFSRGWYAGPVGWIGRNKSEFAVAIRSGLLRGQDFFIYAGAGIVKGSNPIQEWKEIEHKISSALKALS